MDFCVSRDGFFNDRSAVGAMRDTPIGLQYEDQCFSKIPLRFGQCLPLGIDTGNFLDVADVPFAALQIYRCKLSDHNKITLTEGTLRVKNRGELVNTRSRLASERSGYSGTEESDGVAFRQGFFRVDRKTEPLGLYHPVVDLVPVGRMGQQASADWLLSARIHPIHGDQQPFSSESLTDLADRLGFHSNFNYITQVKINEY